MVVIPMPIMDILIMVAACSLLPPMA